MPPPFDLHVHIGLGVRLVPAAVLARVAVMTVTMRPEWLIVVAPNTIVTTAVLPWAWQRWSWRWSRDVATSGWRVIAAILVPVVAVASVAVPTRTRIV